MRRKLLSFILTLVMVLGLIPGGSIVSKAADKTDTLNRAFTGVPNATNYVAWSGKTGTSGAVYAGNSAGGSDTIQLRSNNNNSGIVTTASGGSAKSVTVSWHDSTSAGRTLNIYGKSSAYNSASDLYGSNAGTLIGTIVKGTSTSLTITGDYSFIGMRSNSGAMYLSSVSIAWSEGGATHVHSYSWDGNVGSDGKHTKVCANTDNLCDALSIQEDCVYENGYCKVCHAAEPAPVEYQVTASIQSGEEVIIMQVAGGKRYVLTSTNGSSSAPAAIEFTGSIQGGKISVHDTDYANGRWIVEDGADSSYKFQVKGSDTKYLYTTNANDGVRAGTNTNNEFVVEDNYLKNVATSRYLGIYSSNTGAQDWRCYAVGTNGSFPTNIKDQSVEFYKKVVAGDHVHNYSWNGTTGTNGKHTEVCDNLDGNCDALTRQVDCSMGTGQVTTAATCGADGERTYTCSVCGYQETEVIPATGEHVDANHDYICDVCSTQLQTPEDIVRALYGLSDGQSLTGTYTLSGRITEVVTAYSTQYNDITVNMAVTGANEPNIVQCFRLKASSEAGMSDAVKILAVGDDITVTGTLKNYKGTFEFDKDCELIAFTDNTTHVHSYSWNNVVGENGKHTIVCANSDGLCDALTAQENCTYGEAQTVQPTCNQAGSTTQTCTICGYVKTVAVLPATGEHEDANGDGFCDHCGEAILQYSLAVGDEVALIAKDALNELSAISETATKYGIGVGYTDTPAGVMMLTVEEGSQAGSFAFSSAAGYLAWTAGNSLMTATGLDGNSSWTVTFDGNGNATILNVADPTRQILWNINNPRFAAYAGKAVGADYHAVQLYKFTDTVTTAITGRNAELKADLTLNLYATVDTTLYPGAKMVVTIDGTDEKTIQLPAAPEADGKYKFSYDGVIPSQMNDEIVASLQAADGTELDSKTFTLKSYLEAIPGSAVYAAYSAEKKAAMDTLIDDLLVYGREAQIKFEHNTNKLIVDASYTGSGRTSTENVLTMTPNITSQADAVAAEHGYFKNVNVIHENQNWVRVLYTDKDKDGETTFTMQMGDGAPVAMTLNSGYLCTDGIAPMDYGTVMTFKAIRDGNPIATITYSVYTYCTRKGGNAFVDALYNYGVSAAAFAALD